MVHPMKVVFTAQQLMEYWNGWIFPPAVRGFRRRPHYPSKTVDPVKLAFFNIRIHSFMSNGDFLNEKPSGGLWGLWGHSMYMIILHICPRIGCFGGLYRPFGPRKERDRGQTPATADSFQRPL